MRKRKTPVWHAVWENHCARGASVHTTLMTSHQRRAVKPLTFWGVIAPRAGVRQGTSPPLDFKTLESCVAGATDETIVDDTGTGTKIVSGTCRVI